MAVLPEGLGSLEDVSLKVGTSFGEKDVEFGDNVEKHLEENNHDTCGQKVGRDAEGPEGFVIVVVPCGHEHHGDELKAKECDVEGGVTVSCVRPHNALHEEQHEVDDSRSELDVPAPHRAVCLCTLDRAQRKACAELHNRVPNAVLLVGACDGGVALDPHRAGKGVHPFAAADEECECRVGAVGGLCIDSEAGHVAHHNAEQHPRNACTHNKDSNAQKEEAGRRAADHQGHPSQCHPLVKKLKDEERCRRHAQKALCVKPFEERRRAFAPNTHHKLHRHKGEQAKAEGDGSVAHHCPRSLAPVDDKPGGVQRAGELPIAPGTHHCNTHSSARTSACNSSRTYSSHSGTGVDALRGIDHGRCMRGFGSGLGSGIGCA